MLHTDYFENYNYYTFYIYIIRIDSFNILERFNTINKKNN